MGRWQPLCHPKDKYFLPSHFVHYYIWEFILWNSYFTKTCSQCVKPDDNEGKKGNRILCETELILDMSGISFRSPNNFHGSALRLRLQIKFQSLLFYVRALMDYFIQCAAPCSLSDNNIKLRTSPIFVLSL